MTNAPTSDVGDLLRQVKGIDELRACVHSMPMCCWQVGRPINGFVPVTDHCRHRRWVEGLEGVKSVLCWADWMVVPDAVLAKLHLAAEPDVIRGAGGLPIHVSSSAHAIGVMPHKLYLVGEYLPA